MEPVKVVKSETIWFFLALSVASAITELSGSLEFKEALGSYATIILFFLGLVGMWLRKFTTRPLEPIIKKKEVKSQHQRNLDLLDEPAQSDDDYFPSDSL